jgi:hypothetical protein
MGIPNVGPDAANPEDVPTKAYVDAHITDATDAHDASAISISDAGGLYTATDVEAALAEVRTVANAGGGGGVTLGLAYVLGKSAVNP